MNNMDATRNPACDTYSWCTGGLWHADNSHGGRLMVAAAGDTSIPLDVAVDEEGATEFSYEISDWTFNSDTAKKEFDDMRSIIDQMEQATSSFSPSR